MSLLEATTMELRNLNLQDVDFREMGMLNAFALLSVLVAVSGLAFGFLLTFATPDAPVPATAVTEMMAVANVSTVSTVVPSASLNAVGEGATSESNEGTLMIGAIPTADADLVGKWFLNRRSIGGRILIYEDAKTKVVYVDWTYQDGRREFRTARRSNDKILLGNGSYYLINPAGDLEYRTNEAELVWTAKT